MKSFTFVIAWLVLVVAGCVADPKSGEGFTLPDGDVQLGQQTFVQMQCHACHSISGVEFSKPVNSELPIVSLGGVTPRVRTYGDLVTSIINPSHRFALGYAEEDMKAGGVSKMRIYNDEMTVTQLMNLVAFLQSHYDVESYQPTPYMPFY